MSRAGCTDARTQTQSQSCMCTPMNTHPPTCRDTHEYTSYPHACRYPRARTGVHTVGMRGTLPSSLPRRRWGPQEKVTATRGSWWWVLARLCQAVKSWARVILRVIGTRSPNHTRICPRPGEDSLGQTEQTPAGPPSRVMGRWPHASPQQQGLNQQFFPSRTFSGICAT